MKRWRALGRSTEAFITGWGRYGAERLVASVAQRSPALIARGTARTVGFMDAILTPRSVRFIRELSATHEFSLLTQIRLALARSQVDYLEIAQLVRLSDARDAQSMAHKNGEEVLRHIAAGRPVLVVGVHFPFYHGVCRPMSLATGQALAIGKLVPSGNWRTGIGAITEDFCMNHVVYPAVSRLGEVMYVTWQPQDDMRTARALVRKARQPGFVGVILIDAPGAEWDEFVRPFAGFESRGFPLGAVRMAALAGCAVVPLVAVPGKRGTTNLHWGRLIGPDEVRERDPQAVMSEMVDHLEWGVGAFRFAYGPSAGIERRWDSASGLWTSRHPGAASVESQVARDGDERESSAPVASTTR